MKKQSIQRIQTVILVVICLWIASGWIFARYVHYHSQNRNLNPNDYEIMVVSNAEYDALVDPDQTKVTLQNGSEFIKGPHWNASGFKALAGNAGYARVTTKGTAHHLSRTTSDLLPPFLLALFGVVLSLRHSTKNQTRAEPGAAPNGGPATQGGNSGGAEGPPSVS
jgi:hypothetical protein